MDQNKKTRVVAVIGPIAAGKDALADYLVQQYQAMAVEVGAFARQLTRDAAENEPYLQYDVSAKSLAGRLRDIKCRHSRHKTDKIGCQQQSDEGMNPKTRCCKYNKENGQEEYYDEPGALHQFYSSLFSAAT